MADEYSEEKRVIMSGTSEAARSLFRRGKNFQMQKAGAIAERPVYVRFGAHPGLSAVLSLLKRGMSL